MAHTYSTDSVERRYIPFFIAAAAIGATFLTFHFADKYHFTPPWWASPPIDTMAFYGLFYFFFDRYIWKLPIIRWLRFTKIPDLSGTWQGRVQPIETGGVSAGLRVNTDITVSIQQTWTGLLIAGRTELSKSHSLSGDFITIDEYSVSYEYTNEPSASAPQTMHAHRGTARLSLDKTQTILEGEYYSGRDRQNIGTIRLTRAKQQVG
jgi:hypothetical protein